jgi:hypothetical protein
VQHMEAMFMPCVCTVSEFALLSTMNVINESKNSFKLFSPREPFVYTYRYSAAFLFNGFF